MSKLNYINNQLKQISGTTTNSDILNSVISYINANTADFTPSLDYTKVNADVQTYMNNNLSLFKGPAGNPVVIPSSDISQAVSDYINAHPTDFVKSVNAKSNVVVLNQSDIQGPILYKQNIIDIDMSSNQSSYNFNASDTLNNIWFFRDYSLNSTVFTIQLPSPINLSTGTWVKISNFTFARTIQINGNGFPSTILYKGMTNEAVVFSDTLLNGAKSWVFINNAKA
jgi:hypothetical protein